MTEIIIADRDSFDGALKSFRRKVQRSGILKDLRNKRHYLKPSQKRRKKAAAAERQRRRRSRQR